MGYSHYFYQKRSMTPDEFELFTQDINKLAQAITDLGSDEFETRYGPRGSVRPSAVHPGNILAHGPGLVAGGHIAGVDLAGFCEAMNQGCEVFFVSRTLQGYAHQYELEEIDKVGHRFYSIKTRHRPYDTMVCAALLCLGERAPDAWRISTDGDVENWGAPARFASSVLSRPMHVDLIQGFKDQASNIKTALAPTAWMLSHAEHPEIEKIAGKASGTKKRHAL